MRLRRMGHEGSALDSVSPALRAWASDFGKTQSHQKSSPPLIRPTDVGYLRLTLLSNGTHDGPSMAQRRSLGILPRGLDKRARLSE